MPAAQTLEQQLSELAKVESSASAHRVRQRVDQCSAMERRQVVWCLVGAAVAALAATYFSLLGDPIGYFALWPTTAVLVLSAWRGARQALDLAGLPAGQSLLAAWQTQLHKQLRQIQRTGPLVAVLFTVLSGWVIYRHGFFSLRGGVYGSVMAAIWMFVCYQWLVVLPVLRRELSLVDT